VSRTLTRAAPVPQGGTPAQAPSLQGKGGKINLLPLMFMKF
jgi:hypothetical protein